MYIYIYNKHNNLNSIYIYIYIYIYSEIDNLPSTIIQHIYEYDNTYREKFVKVL